MKNIWKYPIRFASLNAWKKMRVLKFFDENLKHIQIFKRLFKAKKKIKTFCKFHTI